MLEVCFGKSGGGFAGSARLQIRISALGRGSERKGCGQGTGRGTFGEWRRFGGGAAVSGAAGPLALRYKLCCGKIFGGGFRWQIQAAGFAGEVCGGKLGRRVRLGARLHGRAHFVGQRTASGTKEFAEEAGTGALWDRRSAEETDGPGVSGKRPGRAFGASTEILRWQI